MPIFLWAALGVLTELAFVRIFSTTAGETAYYGNLFFIVAIFSLSCGFFMKQLARYAYLIPLLFLLNYFAVLWLGDHYLLQRLPEEYQWGSRDAATATEANFDLQLAVLILCTTMSPVMLLIGACQGAAMVAGGEGKRGYLLMAAGGISGSLVFVVQNLLWPSQGILVTAWCLALVAISLLDGGTRRNLQKLALILLPAAVLMAFCWTYSNNYLWSPYQRVTIRKNRAGDLINMYANDAFISDISLRPEAALRQDKDYGSRLAPFEFIRRGDRVLVLGSGGGTNDVRVALNKGAGHVTAVEIDPRFVMLGKIFDPERSYLRPEVSVNVNDARRYLNTSKETFDFIFMPFLDSHTNACNQSRFRLDSFLYTYEGLRLAYSRLSEGGVMVVSFGTPTEWMRVRMFNLIRQATGREVHVFVLPDVIATSYAVSKGEGRNLAFPSPYRDESAAYQKTPAGTLLPTDDWPFFYSEHATMPQEHIRLLLTLLVGLFCLYFGCRSLTPKEAPETLEPAPQDSLRKLKTYALFSGAAFFFVQIRTISAVTPWFGASYISQSFVIIGIILISLAGAFLAAFRGIKPSYTPWALLFLSVALGFAAETMFHPLSGIFFPSILVYTFFLLMPIFIAGYIYVGYLDGLSPRQVLQLQFWNLAGGAIGGLAEGLIIYTGFHRSLWIVLAFYLLAAASILPHKTKLQALPFQDPVSAS